MNELGYILTAVAVFGGFYALGRGLLHEIFVPLTHEAARSMASWRRANEAKAEYYEVMAQSMKASRAPAKTGEN